MRWIGFVIAMGIMVGFTGWAVGASISGMGLPGLLDKPINVRQGSQHRSGGGVFIYWGGVRRHYGGGYGYGK